MNPLHFENVEVKRTQGENHTKISGHRKGNIRSEYYLCYVVANLTVRCSPVSR